jgi:multidrug efflux pump subunit AcrA (membrane-fusion protein)
MKRISPVSPIPSRAPKQAVFGFLVFAGGIAAAQGIGLVSVVSKPISRTIDLPGEFAAFQSVEIHAKVRGYVERMLVDRGSVVKRGDLLAELTAPEIAGSNRRG